MTVTKCHHTFVQEANKLCVDCVLMIEVNVEDRLLLLGHVIKSCDFNACREFG